MVYGMDVGVFIRKQNKEDLCEDGILLYPDQGNGYKPTCVFK